MLTGPLRALLIISLSYSKPSLDSVCTSTGLESSILTRMLPSSACRIMVISLRSSGVTSTVFLSMQHFRLRFKQKDCSTNKCAAVRIYCPIKRIPSMILRHQEPILCMSPDSWFIVLIVLPISSGRHMPK